MAAVYEVLCDEPIGPNTSFDFRARRCAVYVDGKRHRRCLRAKTGRDGWVEVRDEEGSDAPTRIHADVRVLFFEDREDAPEEMARVSTFAVKAADE